MDWWVKELLEWAAVIVLAVTVFAVLLGGSVGAAWLLTQIPFQGILGIWAAALIWAVWYLKTREVSL